jgi:hypothetical protein
MNLSGSLNLQPAPESPSPQGVAPTDPTVARALALLAQMRRIPMLRGGRISERRLQLRDEIGSTIEAQGVLARLAKRIAFQLVFKFDEGELGNQATWRAVGDELRRETEHLTANLRLVERQIIVALPKLSAGQIEGLLNDLTAESSTIARTVLNVALDAADPRAAARRYMAEYRHVAEQLKAVDPDIARTLANATFMARVPSKKAVQHFKRFAELFMKFRDDVGFARTVARAACRAPNPAKAAKSFIATYEAVLAELTSKGAEPDIARTLAGIASVGSDPVPTAHKLLKTFVAVVCLVKRTHPSVARTIALSACRGADPLAMARLYMNNYDAIVHMVSPIDPHRAREVAAQAFRSDNPLRWAKRYLRELQQTR